MNEVYYRISCKNYDTCKYYVKKCHDKDIIKSCKHNLEYLSNPDLNVVVEPMIRNKFKDKYK